MVPYTSDVVPSSGGRPGDHRHVACVRAHGSPGPGARARFKRSGLPYLNLSPDVAYVGSEMCAACHRETAEVFRRTPMGRSMSLGDDAGHLAKAVKPVVIGDRRSNRNYKVFVRDKELYQSEYELDENGKELFRKLTS